MASPLLRFFARYAIARAIANGQALDHAKLDTMFADIAASIERLVTRVDGVTNVSGTLKNLAEATAQALAGSQRFSATAGQTAFTTTIVWRAAFSSANVAVHAAGVRIDPNAVTVANSGGFLRVTIAAQTLGTIVVVDASESGAGLLTTLASTANGAGASLVGIEDLAGKLSATTVEGAIAELATDHDTLVSDLGTLATICRTSGFTMAAAIAMGNFKITGLAAGVDDHDAVRMDQISAAALLAVLTPTLAAQFLSLEGGTMSGPIDMGGQAIQNVLAGVDDGDAVNRAQLDAIQSTVTASLSAPPGLLGDFAGPIGSIPNGWLYCDGSAVSRTTYANLFTAIGSTWGAGDSATTFNLPDFRGYGSIGQGTGTIDKVTGTTITAGGTSYSSAPTVTFSGGGATVQATAEAEVSGGAVVTIRLLTRGSGYTSAPSVVISGGGGSGATVTASISLTARVLAEKLGEESHILTEAELAKHRHTEKSSGGSGTGSDGGGGSVGEYSTNTGYTGSNTALNVMQPSRPVTKIIKT